MSVVTFRQSRRPRYLRRAQKTKHTIKCPHRTRTTKDQTEITARRLGSFKEPGRKEPVCGCFHLAGYIWDIFEDQTRSFFLLVACYEKSGVKKRWHNKSIYPKQRNAHGGSELPPLLPPPRITAFESNRHKMRQAGSPREARGIRAALKKR